MRPLLNAAQSEGRNLGATKNSLDYKRLIQPIIDSGAFDQFASGRDMRAVGRDAFLEAFKLFPDASAFVITGRITRASSALASITDNRKDLLERFIMEGRDAFGF